MQELSIQEKIELLIRQLEEEMRKLSSFHEIELNKLKEVNSIDLHRVKLQLKQQIALTEVQYQSRIRNLENEIGYQKELILSQRLMMEDNLEYIKGLEEKLNTTPSLD